MRGVRSENLLHSAGPGSLDLFELMAAYAFGLAGNHPSNEGNERTARGCCVLFLKARSVGWQCRRRRPWSGW